MITERKRTEEALRESEERFVSFMRHLPGFAFVKDHDRRVLYVNELSRNRLRPPASTERQGKTNDEIWPGEVGEKIRRDDEAVLAAGEPARHHRERARARRTAHLHPHHQVPHPTARRPGHWLGGMSVDITELKQTEAALRASLEEKESLLKEVHHRVKNNLQVVSSLLKPASPHRSRTAERSIVPAETRGTACRSMAMLHEILYRSDNFAKIDFPQYVKSVCTHVAHSYGSDAKNIRLKQEIADVALNPDQAITAGLIINELVANAFKHAFPSRSDGEILVELQAAGEHHLVLRVSDNGVGFPAERSPQSAETLGLLLVSNLSRQLDGQLSVTGEQGTVFQIVFPAHSV
ncbi:MAG: ATP-binding protein [Desulfomicrobium escambiense]|nr:ATP-binding protein [Desulfomicrobium escambiense]